MNARYTEKHATRAADRWERRSMGERLTLLRALLSRASFSAEPSYNSGPPLWAYLVEMAAYFAAMGQTATGEVCGFGLKTDIREACERGIETAIDHQVSFRNRWGGGK